MSWSISVKTVGGADRSKPSNDASEAGKGEPSNFTVLVNPDDRMSTLHSQIEDVTGLKASQQRLIYRGRIISGGSGKPPAADASAERGDICVREVDGLCDGQTIHLVPRKAETTSAPPTCTTETGDPASADDAPSTPGHPNTGFLAALLGLGSSRLLATADDDDSDEQETDFGTLFSLPRATSAGSAARRRSTNSHRRSATDPRYPEPRPLEPVRQNLMTLHTMLGTALQRSDSASRPQDRRPNTLASHRKWYRGQWIDCRDTVNQWLESTVVDVVLPEDILENPTHAASSVHTTSTTSRAPATDPVTGANDFDGRRRLLLEPSDDENDEELADLNCDQALTGYRLRGNNEGVQLLLVHYNGWPHRWDEWIRSDSERIRPFRTRTKHQPTRSHFASPESQSLFHAAPATHIKDKEDVTERSALLPELYRAMTAVTGLLGESLPQSQTWTEIKANVGSQTNNRLPWISNSHDDQCVTGDGAHTSVSRKQSDEKRQLEALAPILDRLGRALVDVAPHIAALADSLPDGPVEDSDPEIHNLPETTDDNVLSSLSLRPSWSTGRENLASESVISEQGDGNDYGQDPEDVSNEPDYVDFVNGFVNVSPGEARSSSRNLSRRNSRDDDTGSGLGSSLLSAYLSAAGLGNQTGESEGTGNNSGPRVVRLAGGGGGGGPGIDIHIHAIVTGPGTGFGGFGGLAGLAAMNATPTNTLETNAVNSGSGTSHNNNPDTASIVEITAPTQEDEDELGLFSDLYSENPTSFRLNNDEPLDVVYTLNLEPEDVDANDGSMSLLLDGNVNANPALGTMPDNLEATVSTVVDEMNVVVTSTTNSDNPTSFESNEAELSDDLINRSVTSSSIAPLHTSRNAEASPNSSAAEQRRLSSSLSRLFRRTLSRRQS